MEDSRVVSRFRKVVIDTLRSARLGPPQGADYTMFQLGAELQAYIQHFVPIWSSPVRVEQSDLDAAQVIAAKAILNQSEWISMGRPMPSGLLEHQAKEW
jgi:hypothetical protein